jgi:hypothetical protein
MTKYNKAERKHKQTEFLTLLRVIILLLTITDSESTACVLR